MDESIAKGFMELFAGLQEAHGRFVPGEIDETKGKVQGKASTVREPVTLSLWLKHLSGSQGLGIVPINKENMSRWGAIDVDDYKMDHLALLKKIYEKELPLYMTRSKSGGVHIFLFLSDYIPAGDVQDLLRSWCVDLGLAGMEIFPKQRKLLFQKGDTGNWLNMPYFGDARWMVRMDGSEIPPAKFLELAKPVDPKSIKPFEIDLDNNPVKDGPPCLQALVSIGFESGTRNNGLFAIGTYLKKAKPQSWTQDLPQWNAKFMKPPLPAQEVGIIIEQLKKKDYFYRCSDQPLCSHCDVKTCRTRKYGVGQAGIITEIRKLESDGESIFFVELGTAKLALNKKQLYNQELFNQECIEFANFALPPLSKADWITLINAHLSGIEQRTDKVQRSATQAGQWHDLLVDFLTIRVSNDAADLLNGRPYHDINAQRYYFRFKDFDLFLTRRKWSVWTKPRIVQEIRTLNGGDKIVKTNVTGRIGVRTFWVPDEALQRRDEEE